jgi:hypothetical protein
MVQLPRLSFYTWKAWTVRESLVPVDWSKQRWMQLRQQGHSNHDPGLTAIEVHIDPDGLYCL